MDLDAYRQQTLAEINAAPAPPAPPDANLLMNTLADPGADPGLRLSALRALLSLAFHELNFAPYRPRFLDILAHLAADPKADAQLRAEAVEKLAQEKHPVAATLLNACINNPAQAFLPLAKAVQLLALDDHGAAGAAARVAIRVSNDASVWTEAMHALAGDPSAAPLLESVLADKNRPADVRLASAAGLRALDPARLLAQAANIVADHAEGSDLKADMLTALTAAHTAINQPLDPVLAGIVQTLSANSLSAPLRDAARRLLNLPLAP